MTDQNTSPKRMTKRIALLQKAREMGHTFVDLPGLGISEEGLRLLVEGGNIPADVKVMATEARKVETDEEILKRIETRFRMLDLMVDSCCMGTTRSLIISGLAGLGKSYPVEMALKALDPKGTRTGIVKGFATAVGLLGQLWDHRHEGSILVIDDADAIFYDEKALTSSRPHATSRSSARSATWPRELDSRRRTTRSSTRCLTSTAP